MDYNYLIKHTETYENYKELLEKVNEILDRLENNRKDFDKLVEYRSEEHTSELQSP